MLYSVILLQLIIAWGVLAGGANTAILATSSSTPRYRSLKLLLGAGVVEGTWPVYGTSKSKTSYKVKYIKVIILLPLLFRLLLTLLLLLLLLLLRKFCLSTFRKRTFWSVDVAMQIMKRELAHISIECHCGSHGY